MLNKINRIKKDKEFRQVFRKSRPTRAGRLSVRVLKNNLSVARIGFVVSNKIEKRATRRNALKRRLRAGARELILTLKPGYDVVVVVNENYPYPYDYTEMKKDLEAGISKAGI